jgi:transcriptional regulator of acetoin/glycerol metabolism
MKSLNTVICNAEKAHMQEALNLSKGKTRTEIIVKAAKKINTSERTMYRRIKAYKLKIIV